jgi:hypothetical protein
MAEEELFALTGLFDQPEKILEAARKVVAAGYKDFDIHTPYPVKGLPEAMSLKPSGSGYPVFILAALGGLAILGFMSWTSAVDYPQVIGGKNFLALPAYIPITFEITILTAALSAFIILVTFRARLPANAYPLHDTAYFREISRDKFGISIEKKDPLFDEAKVTWLLQEAGAQNIQPVYFQKPDIKISRVLFSPGFLGFLAVIITATFFITSNIFSRLLEQRPFTSLDSQDKLLPQHNYRVEKLGRLKPPEGSVPRGFTAENPGSPEAEKYLVNPLLSTSDVLEKGRTGFNAFCSPCHGYSARGTDSRLKNLFPVPPDLLAPPVTGWSDGKIYQVITHGQMIMPSYASQIIPEDRWKIVLYIRALQQAEKSGELPAK